MKSRKQKVKEIFRENRYSIITGILIAFIITGSLVAFAATKYINSRAATCTTTLQSMIDNAPSGSTLTVPDCIFREIVSIKKPLTLDGQGKAEIRGSDIWTSWTKNGTTWVSTKQVPQFSNSMDKCMSDDNGNAETDPRKKGLCSRQEQIFLDGKQLQQVSYGIKTGEFLVNSNRQIEIVDDPTGHLMEVSIRQRWVMGSSDNVTIRGFIMKHAANAAQSAALFNEYHKNWIIENNNLSFANGQIVSISRATGGKILNNEVSFAGQLGIAGGNPDGLLVKGNRIHHNNTRGFSCNWECGGLKLGHAINTIIDSNESYENYGYGLWCDVYCSGVTFSNNRVHDNANKGIVQEISGSAKIFGNAVWNNGFMYSTWGWGAGILVQNSDNVEVYNNILAWNADGTGVISQGGRNENPSASNNTIHDNIVAQDTGSALFTLGDSLGTNTFSGNKVYTQGNGGVEITNGFSKINKTELDAALRTANIPLSPGVKITPTQTVTQSPTYNPTLTTTSKPSITPTVTPTTTPSSGTLTIPVFADTHVKSDETTTVFGSDFRLFTDASPERITYLKFDMSQLEDKKITSAKLQVRTWDDDFGKSNDQQQVKFVEDATWDEAATNYSNRPAVTNTVLGTFIPSARYTIYTIQLPTEILQQHTEDYISFALTSSGTDVAYFASKESTTPTDVPKLIVTYEAETGCTNTIASDANCDKSIDLLDFEIFRQEYIAFRSGTLDITTAKANFEPDQSIDLLDFEIFRVAFVKQRTSTPTPTVTTQPTTTPTKTPTPTSNPASKIELYRPRNIIPEFVQPDGTFTAEVRGPATLPATGWSAIVANDLRSWDTLITSATYDKINNKSEPGWILKIKVPAEISPELFRLTISNSSGGSSSNSQAVSVVKNFNDDFYILQLTDEHVLYDKAINASGEKSKQLVEWATPAVNLINPRFVINTGDDTHQYQGSLSNPTKNSGNKYLLYQQAKDGYQVPSITMPGNHDIWPASQNLTVHNASALEWEKYMGPRSFSVNVGQFSVIAHDYTSSDGKIWATNEYNAIWNDPNIKYRIVAQHYTGEKAFIPDSSKPCDLMLIGHLHSTEKRSTTCKVSLMSTTARVYAHAGFIQFKKDASGKWFTPSSNIWGTSETPSLVGDWGAPKLQASYAKANDGTQSSNTVTIKNDLGKEFWDGRVRFLMPAGSYAVTGGEIIKEYNYNDNKNTALLVKVTIKSTGTTTVSITPKQANNSSLLTASFPFLFLTARAEPIFRKKKYLFNI